MVKDNSESERENLLPPLHGLLFPISSKGFFYVHGPIVRIAHITAFVYTSCRTLAGTRKSPMSLS